MTADYAYSGSADNEDDDRCERARTSFIEEARNEFRLPNLFEEQAALLPTRAIEAGAAPRPGSGCALDFWFHSCPTKVSTKCP